MQRYFINPDQVSDGQIEIYGDDIHHVKNVMRLSAGDCIICCDGEGIDYRVRIQQVEDHRILCRIEERFLSEGEPKLRITVAQSLPKREKMEWVIQKGTELGADRFQPFTSARTVVKLDGKKASKRRERWRRIAKEAAEQAHRGRIPVVEPLLDWNGLLQSFTAYDRVFFAYEKGGHPLKEVAKFPSDASLLLVIGPEGGFPESEAEEAKAAGAVSIHLGPRILRAETAPLALLACLLYSNGEMGGEPL
ncbi:16S rRNA (uracil(1498)-N(3))-methyltransferase [Paludifilum halophilum]|uniref:Ribosomal RNA small subunit methyltransferase E n=1 Tax=Paludifilum halophilum TaxID=1642702 RepID=A0A235B7T8_9BACL|nr:16S rRNA (uracil(1498)-N(3))-methyltransferase [Paludifilum halophilum]OYD07655.1 16S rRNA (uracil(1498)-N(3))-methyltransferase [Paludifilum halophilum]